MLDFSKNTWWFVLVLIILASCNDKDTEEPEVFINEPTAGTVVNTGGNLHIDVTLSDNEGLAQYRIKVVKNFSGPYAKTDTIEAWNHIEVGDASGTDQTISKDIEISSDAAAGNYYLLLSCVDVNNWESEVDTVEFSVVNTQDTVAPTILLNSPAVMQEFNIGDTILLYVLVSDDLKVLDVNAIVQADSDSSKVFETTTSINASNGNMYTTTPTNTWSAGSYTIYYTAYDSVNNQAEEVVPIILN